MPSPAFAEAVRYFAFGEMRFSSTDLFCHLLHHPYGLKATNGYILIYFVCACIPRSSTRLLFWPWHTGNFMLNFICISLVWFNLNQLSNIKIMDIKLVSTPVSLFFLISYSLPLMTSRPHFYTADKKNQKTLACIPLNSRGVILVWLSQFLQGVALSAIGFVLLFLQLY